ncbi:ribonuclease E inhibitor RraB, partial [Pseudoalteromonas sp. GABNS16H]|uniref:ribonuclease E inhibitor RraB n=2 Tax=unclassified Pseudoalteromonas TaxID=194690 RepID=UPI0030811721
GIVMSWPEDADGDVLRRLDEQGFDFSSRLDIDFMIDFKGWPPSSKAIDLLVDKFGSVEIYDPDDEGQGYILVKVNDRLTCELVVHYQSEISLIMGAYDGWCESWGVLSNA